MGRPQNHFCQSCSMPMSKVEDFGTHADGSRNDEFCRYCFQDGKFTEPDITLAGMIEKCSAMMKEMHVPDVQIEQTKTFIPMLKRWRTQ
jgi:hypothetical protein